MSKYTRYPDPAGGIKIYPSVVNFPPSAQDGAQAVAADTNTIYIYDTSVPGWQPVANPGAAVAIDGLQADVSATGPGVVNATVNSVGGAAAADIASATNDVLAATALSTASTLMKRDASAKTALKGLSLDGATSGTLSIDPPAVVTSYSVVMPDAQGASNTLLQNDGSGNLSWDLVDLTVNVDGILPVANGGTGTNYIGPTEMLFGSPDGLSIDRSEFFTYDASIGLLLNVGGQMQTRSLAQGPNDPSSVVINDKVEVLATEIDGSLSSGRVTKDTIESKKDISGIQYNASMGWDGVDSWIGVSKTENLGNNISMVKLFPYKAQLFTVDIGAGTGPQPILPVQSYDLVVKKYVDDATALAANKTLSNLNAPTALNQVLRGQDGTSSAPAYSFTNETGLGLYRVSSGILGLQASAIQSPASTLTIGSGQAGSSVNVNFVHGGDQTSFQINSGTIFYQLNRGLDIVSSNFGTALYSGYVQGVDNSRAGIGTKYEAYGSGPSKNRFFSQSNQFQLHVGKWSNVYAIDGGALSVTRPDDYGLYCGLTATGTTTITVTPLDISGTFQKQMIAGVGNYLKITQTGQPDLIVKILSVTGNNLVVSQTVPAVYNNGNLTVLPAAAVIRNNDFSTALEVDYKGDTFINGNVQVPNYILSPQLYDAGTKTGNFSLDLGANGPCQQVTINAAGPLVLTLSNPVTGGAYLLKIVQGATTGTITFPANVKWGAAGAPTLSATTGLIDIINLYWDGTNYFGTYALGF